VGVSWVLLPRGGGVVLYVELQRESNSVSTIVKKSVTR